MRLSCVPPPSLPRERVPRRSPLALEDLCMVRPEHEAEKDHRRTLQDPCPSAELAPGIRAVRTMELADVTRRWTKAGEH